VVSISSILSNSCFSVTYYLGNPGYELFVIAAVVVGGTILAGGDGGLRGLWYPNRSHHHQVQNPAFYYDPQYYADGSRSCLRDIRRPAHITVGEAIKQANRASIPVFTADIACLAEGVDVKCHIAADDYAGGVQAGKVIIEAISRGGCYSAK